MEVGEVEWMAFLWVGLRRLSGLSMEVGVVEWMAFLWVGLRRLISF
jgi:hypothetical protein